MREIRVHGVGGPQEPRLLGVESERDLEVVAVGSGTRFVRRYKSGADDEVEGYSWGGLTSTSLHTAGWLLFLPFTLINAAGWASPHTASRRAQRFHGFLCRVVGLAATATYVFWTGLLLVDLVGWQWRRRLLELGAVRDTLWLSGLVEYVMPLACAALFAALVAALFLLMRTRAPVPDPVGDRARWAVDESFRDPDFYYHAGQLAKWRTVHLGTAVAAALALLAAAVLRHEADKLSLGQFVVGAGVVEGGCLVLLWLLAVVERARPVSAMAATLGAVAANAAFAGLALLAVKHLSTFPELPATAGDLGVQGGPELGFTSAWLWSLLAGLVAVAISAAHLYFKPVDLSDLPPAGGGTGPVAPPWHISKAMRKKVESARRMARLAHSALVPGYYLAGAFVVGGTVYAAIVLLTGQQLSYRPGAWPEWIGGVALVAVPGLVGFGLRKAALDPEGRRTLGTLWDVLVVWPARYHPLAVPPYAARATLELASRIVHHAQEGPVLLSAHSQGTALSFIALSRIAGTDPATLGRVHFLTYGSHLNGLYGLAFPRHFNREAFCRLREELASWHSFWRRSDPIGGPVFAFKPYQGDPVLGEVGESDEVCSDPATSTSTRTDLAEPDGAPLERDRQRGIDLAVHSWYLAEPQLKAYVDRVKRASPPSALGAQLWRPHSVRGVPAQRPERGSAPSGTGRVQGRQPTEG